MHLGPVYPKREEVKGKPLRAIPVNNLDDLHRGDHILYQVSQYPYRHMYYSALIIDIIDPENAERTTLKVITNSVNDLGVVQKFLPFNGIHASSLHKVVYSHQYEVAESIQRAMKRIDENHYHSLCNNGHFFVSWCKTGQESQLQDIIKELESAGM